MDLIVTWWNWRPSDSITGYDRWQPRCIQQRNPGGLTSKETGSRDNGFIEALGSISCPSGKGNSASGSRVVVATSALRGKDHLQRGKEIGGFNSSSRHAKHGIFTSNARHRALAQELCTFGVSQ